MLALRARGLGSTWTTLHLLYEQEAAELLRIPPEVTQTVGDVLVAVPLWATWGLIGGGLPLLALLALARRLRRGVGHASRLHLKPDR